MGNELRLVELARQEGDAWVWRDLINDTDVAQHITSTWAAYFKSTFTLHVQPEDRRKDVSLLFERSPKTGDFFFDFDSADLAKAQVDAETIRLYLHQSLGVQEEAMQVYESGGKGYHLMVSEQVLGLEPRPDLHLLYGKLAKSLASLAPNKTVDIKIYNARRMFRVPNTVHQKTKRKKTLLSGPVTWGTGLQLAPLLRQALLAPDIKEKEIRQAKRRIPAEFFYEPLDCIKSVMDHGMDEGKRNDTCYTVALYWKSLGLSTQATENKLLASALHLVSGVTKAEVLATVSSAFKGDTQFGLRDSVLGDLVTDRDRQRWKTSKIDEEYETYGELIDRYLEELEHPKRLVGQYYVGELDSRSGGIISGELVVLGGSTGTGKSEFAFHVAYENALRGVPSAFVSLELDNISFVSRKLRSLAGIKPQALFTMQVSEDEKALLKDHLASQRVINPPLYFRKAKNLLTIDELERLVQNLILEQQARLIIIDHLHFLAPSKRYDSENENVAYSIRSLNSLALKYGVGILVVAHFRKQPDNQHQATLHEFRDSSAIEQTAHTVLLLWRNLDGIGSEQYRTTIRIAKTRKDVPLSTVETVFDPTSRSYL